MKPTPDRPGRASLHSRCLIGSFHDGRAPLWPEENGAATCHSG
jgi:hypothetical protein